MPKTTKELVLRISTVVVVSPFVLYCLQSSTTLFFLIQLLHFQSLYEFEVNICTNISKLHRQKFFLPFLGIGVGCAAAVNKVTFDAAMNISVLLVFLKHLLGFRFEDKRNSPSKDTLVELALSLFGIYVIITGFGYAILVRNATSYGVAFQILTTLCMWNTDNGALLIGSWLGKSKLLPALSPQKTKVGAFGGVFFSVVTCVAVFAIAHSFFPGTLPTIGFVHQILLGSVVGVAAIFGDLAESYVKRIADVKDSGQFFPGHGGCLDRMDSMLLVTPVVYYWSIAIEQRIL